MKVAVCDDEKEDLYRHRDFIQAYDSSLSFDLFSSAADLLEAFESNIYDIVFLDIEMEPIDGFTAAQTIVSKYDKPLIIFTTKSSQFTIQGYEVAFRYLVKPVSYEVFAKVLKAALAVSVPRRICLEANNQQFLVPLRDVLYFEVLNHVIGVQTVSDTYFYRDSLKNTENLLAGSDFARPHNSYIINLEHIFRITQKEVTMTNGFKINISRKRKDDFFFKMHQYLRR
jgi:DNA-binding LytR/AlgR family response regulator